MKQLQVKTSSSEYPIYIGEDCLSVLAPFLQQATQTIVVTDQTVYDLHYQKLSHVLPENTITYIITPGESSKSFDCYHQIQTFLIENQVDRQACLLAFGGGVVGDLVGFVAATYMRGIDFIQIPTTLLAHDSAIGGKVAINHELGKNLIGAFYPPKAVVYDLRFLRTLSEKEWRCGLAEMVKHGFIANPSLLRQLLQIQSLDALLDETFAQLLIQSLMVKMEIVQMDEFEQGCRAYLNFGHTFGHAIELDEKELSHGEAVAIGILFSLYLSEHIFGIDLAIGQYLTYLKRLHFPLPFNVDHAKRYLGYMMHDKKNQRKQVRFVLLNQLAKPELVSFSIAELETLLKQFLSEFTTKEERVCH